MLRVGIKRIREAKQLYDGAQDAYVQHYRECWACYAAHRDQDPRRYCERGWTLAKTQQACYMALCRVRGEMHRKVDGEQLVLF